jgi:hypothetical protein
MKIFLSSDGDHASVGDIRCIDVFKIIGELAAEFFGFSLNILMDKANHIGA